MSKSALVRVRELGQAFGSRMLVEGVWGEQLRLFSEHSAQGVQASVYGAKNWIAPSESVDDIEQGKERAEAYATAYLKNCKM